MARRGIRRSGPERNRQAVFQQEKNRVRGVVGFATSQPLGEIGVPSATADERFTDAIRRVLLDSRRKALADEERRALVELASGVRASGIRNTKELLGFGPGRYIHRSKGQSFRRELSWLHARLEPFVEELAQFRAIVTALDEAFWRGKEERVWQLLQDIERLFGDSLWSIELRLALTQHYKGLDDQKAQLKRYRRRYASSLPAFLAHYFSARNEAGSTIRLFRDDARRRLDGVRIFNQSRTYLKYKLADEFTPRSETLSSIIRSELSQSVIDIYETAIDLLQRLTRSRVGSAYRESILDCIATWEPIKDFRLAKIALALDAPPSVMLPVRHTRAIEWASVLKVGIDSNEMSQVLPSDALTGFERLLVSAPSTLIDTDTALPWTSLSARLQVVLLRQDGFEEAFGGLEKFGRNLRGLPGAAAVADLLEFITAQESANRSSLGAFTLNIASISVWDLLWATGSQQKAVADHLASAGISMDLISALAAAGGSNTELTPSVLGQFLIALGTARKDPDAACVRLLDVESDKLSPELKGVLVSRRIELALTVQDFGTAIADIASEVARNSAVRIILPAEQAIANRTWAELSAKNNLLDLAITLDVALRRTNDDLYASFLRYALEDLLSQRGVHRPSELISGNQADKSKLIYLLEHIAIPEVMDLTGLFSSSQEVIEERAEICRALGDLNPENRIAYEEEVREIEKGRLIQEGLRIIDYSRINVDMAAISRWAEQRYKESYSRYRSLLEAGIGVSEDIDDVIRTSATPERSGEHFYTPDNEADALLLEMTLALKDQFLNNEEYGLEFFLGKRIRHGTLAGHLRGPAESVGLITQRESEFKPYNPNYEWLSKLHFQKPAQREAVDKAFRDFSERFDAIAKRLKDEFFHVRSKRFPNGVFDFQMSQLAFQILRSAIKSDLSFEGFVASCYIIFWMLLDPSLTAAKSLLSPEAKDDAAALFDELQNVVRENVIHDDCYGQFVVAVRGASVDVQRQFDSMLEWFTKREVEQASHRFSLEEVVDISVRSALKANRGYHPELSVEVDDFVRAPVSLLVVLSDILSIIVSNACVRSKSGYAPNITIKCHMNDAEDVLIIKVINSLGAGYDRESSSRTLEEIRRRVARGDIQKGASVEGSSGLLKIATLTQAQGSSLDFAIEEGGTFLTVVRLSVITREGGLAVPAAR